jgi:hypothetical protein
MKFKEHQVVQAATVIREDDVSIEVGQIGTVVHVMPNDNAYLVEWSVGASVSVIAAYEHELTAVAAE